MTAHIGLGKREEEQLINYQEEYLQTKNNLDQPEKPDESWWAAVLADEPLIEEQAEPPELLDLNEPSLSESDQNRVNVHWDQIFELFDNDEIIVLEVVGYNRGGILVSNMDMHGFVPASHLIDIPINASEDEREQYLNSYLGREISLKVIECEPEKDRLVFSERAALAGAGQRKELLHSLSEGDVVNGVVTNVTSFGAFVDLGGLEGLIHVSELSWGRVQRPSTILNVGDVIQTMVIQISEDQGRVGLSLKRLEKNPWNEISKNLFPGDVVDAVISSIVKYGAFARLEEGIEGLIHVSSMNFPNDCKHVDEFLFEGQTVKVGIISLDPQKRRLGLKLESI